MLMCETAEVCRRPTCDANNGCGGEVAIGGVCSGAAGSVWGSCNGQHMAPVDTCTNAGACQDNVAQTALPLQKDTLTGDWFMAIQTAFATGRGNAAGIATFATDGRWTGIFRSQNEPFTVQDPFARDWCLDSQLGVAFDLGPNRFIGQVTSAGEAFVASGKIGNEVVIGLRPNRALADVDGTYAVMMSGLDAAGQLATSYATLAFSHGCLAEGAVLVGTDEPTFIADNGACFELLEDGVVTVSFTTESDDGAEGVLAMRGAIGARGDALVLVRDGVGKKLDFGTTVLVRLDDSVARSFVGTTRWTFAMQERADPFYLGFPATLVANGPELVNGVLGNVPVNDGRFDFDDYGRFLATLRSPTVRRSLAGYLSASLGFGFLYEVTVPDDWVTLFDVSEAPAWPSFGVIAKRP